MAGNGQAIIALDAKRMAASVAKDFDALNQIIADDLIYTHSSARMDTKASLIGNMKSGSTFANCTRSACTVTGDVST